MAKCPPKAGIYPRSIASDVATYEAQIYLQTWKASFRSVPVCTQAKPNLLGQCRLTRNVETSLARWLLKKKCSSLSVLTQVDSFRRKQELASSKSFDVQYYKMMEMGSRPIVKYEK